MVKILDRDYTNPHLEQVASNATHMNAEDRNQLLGLLKYFRGLFDSTPGDWDTEPVNLDLNTYYKPFNCKYYPVPRINKETFQKELQKLV